MIWPVIISILKLNFHSFIGPFFLFSRDIPIYKRREGSYEGITLVSHQQKGSHLFLNDVSVPPSAATPENDVEVKFNPLNEDDEEMVFQAPQMFSISKMRNFRTMTDASNTSNLSTGSATSVNAAIMGASAFANGNDSDGTRAKGETPYLDVAALPPGDYMVTKKALLKSKWRHATNEEIVLNIRKLSATVATGSSARYLSNRPSGSNFVANDLGGESNEPVYDTIKFNALLDAEQVTFKVIYQGSKAIACE